MLDGLDLADLYAKSMLNAECERNSQNAFIAKYNPKTSLILQGPFTERMGKSIEVSKNEIFVRNIFVVRQMIRVFGSFINTIIVDFENISVNNGKMIVKFLNDRAFEVVGDLRFLNCRGNVLDGLKNQFERVVAFRFSTNAVQSLNYNTENPNLPEVFPTLNYLRLDYIKPSDWNFIDGTIHNLFNFNIELPDSRKKDGNDEIQIIRFLAKNRQIEQLTLSKTNLKLLKAINETLPKLEFLFLVGLAKHYMDNHDNPVELRSLKDLMILPDKMGKLPIKVAFSELFQLNIELHEEFNDKWLLFLIKQVNRDLVQFTLYCPKISIVHFLTIPEHFHSLRAAIFIGEFHLESNDILSFMAKAGLLKYLELNIKMIETEQQRLKTSLTTNWNLTYTPYDNGRVIIQIKLTQ